MDTVTQIVLGSAIAEAAFREKLGRSAIFFGALCGWLPDIDFFFHPSGSWEALQEHRGMTHSLVFLTAMAPILGGGAFLADRRIRGDRHSGEARDWILLAFWALITHPLLDLCTSYGTQIFYPFSDYRYATDAISIIDFIYTLPLLLAAILAFRASFSASPS